MEMMEGAALVKELGAGQKPVIDFVHPAGPERGWLKAWKLPEDGRYDRWAVWYGWGNYEYGQLLREVPVDDPSAWLEEGWEE